MKKVTLVLGMIAMTISSFAQTKINTLVDEMTDEVSYRVDKRLVISNPAQTKGFAIEPYIKEKNGKIYAEMMLVSLVGLGNCNEKNKIIILFDDGSKFTSLSWNSFNCTGDAYFTFTKDEIKQLSTKTLSKIRVQNGETFESLTADVEAKNYFIEFYKLLN